VFEAAIFLGKNDDVIDLLKAAPSPSPLAEIAVSEPPATAKGRHENSKAGDCKLVGAATRQ